MISLKISFRPVIENDLPLLSAWIGEPHWQAWWGEVEEEIGYIKDMLDGRDTTRPFIFQVNGEDTGYIQVWSIADQIALGWDCKEPWLNMVPGDSVGVDLSIGSAAHLAKGIGTKALKAFVQKLRDEGYQKILIDPERTNLRAVQCYRKAGFEEIESLLGKTGACLIMEHTKQEGVS